MRKDNEQMQRLNSSIKLVHPVKKQNNYFSLHSLVYKKNSGPITKKNEGTDLEREPLRRNSLKVYKNALNVNSNEERRVWLKIIFHVYDWKGKYLTIFC
jgi:hypothetical protein